MDWRDKKREAGHKDVLVWLTPEAVTGLAALQAGHAKASVAEIVSAAIVQAANDGLALDGGNQVVLTDQLAELRDAIASLTARLVQLEARPVQTPTTVTEPKVTASTAIDAQPTAKKRPKKATGTGTSKVDRRRRVDPELLAAAVAERRERDGDDYSRAELYRDLKAAGITVHSTPQNFSHWIKHKLAKAPATA